VEAVFSTTPFPRVTDQHRMPPGAASA